MKLQNAPALVLAIGLQLAPVGRMISTSTTAAINPAGIGIVCRWLACAAALLGAYDTVSGASAAIAGVANTSPPGPVTTNATGNVGQSFSYRIIVTNPGSSHAQDYWNAVPLPPGLTINTNVGGNGYITGTPTVAGVYPVTLTAGNMNSPIIVHKDITITIQGGTTPPGITGQPQSQIVSAGASVTLSVVATGSNLTYYWRLDTNLVQRSSAASLTLANVAATNSGFYSVIVSNSAGSLVSSNAQLLVVSPPDVSTAPALTSAASGAQVLLSWQSLAGYRYVLESSDTLATNSWTTVADVPPVFTNHVVNLPQDPTVSPQRFFRVQMKTN